MIATLEKRREQGTHEALDKVRRSKASFSHLRRRLGRGGVSFFVPGPILAQKPAIYPESCPLPERLTRVPGFGQVVLIGKVFSSDRLNFQWGLASEPITQVFSLFFAFYAPPNKRKTKEEKTILEEFYRWFYPYQLLENALLFYYFVLNFCES